MVYNHTIYTTVKQCSFTCTHNDGLQPHHLHRTADTNCKPFLAWTMIIYTAVKQRQFYMSAQWWFTTTLFTLLSSSATLQAHTVTIYNHFLHYQTVQLYKLAQWWCTTTQFTLLSAYNFTCRHSNENMLPQPHHLHCCKLYIPAQWWATTTPFTPL